MNANHSPATAWAALPVLLAGAFMVVLDFFIVNVALPSIATDLDAGDSALEWIVAGYGLTFAAFLITAGRLGDDLGRRRVYAIGLALFTVASAACGLAPSPTTLVLARITQGVAGAVVMPQVLAIIGVTYRGTDYVRALSIYGVVLGLAAVGGQVIGGAFVETDFAGLGWRSCFLINVPVGLAALALTPRLVPESRAERRSRLDVTGAAAVAVGLTAILLPLIEGRELGWPAWTWISLALAPVILAAFVLRQRRLGEHGGDPLVDLRLFGERGFSAGLATQLFLAATQASFFVFLAFYLQLGRGLGALEAGLVFTILAVAYVATSGPAPALTARFGRAVVAAGGLALTLGLALLAVAMAEVGTEGSLLTLVPGLLLAGAGIGLCFTPLTSTVLANVDPARAGSASGVMSAMQQVGFALGVAITGVVFFGTADDGIAYAFQVSLIQLTAVSAGIVAMARLLPRVRSALGPDWCGRKSGMSQMSHKANKWPIRWMTSMEYARIDISQDLDGLPVVHACFDLTGPEIAACGRAVAASAAERFRMSELSADEVLELRELTAVTDDLGELTGGMGTVVLKPARLSILREAASRFVQTRDESEWLREEDREALAVLREMIAPLEALCGEATRAALAPEQRSHS